MLHIFTLKILKKKKKKKKGKEKKKKKETTKYDLLKIAGENETR